MKSSKIPPEDSSIRTFDFQKAQKGVRLLLEAAGADPNRSALSETLQHRFPEAFATLTQRQRKESKPTMKQFETKSDELVVKENIPFYSLCEHHLLPFFGRVHIGYRPDKAVAGLSKLTRYVRWQSRQLTIQETLTKEITDGLKMELEAKFVFVEMHATHLCEAMRGVEVESATITQSSAGKPSEGDYQDIREMITRRSDI